jgi:hypothetical protein
MTVKELYDGLLPEAGEGEDANADCQDALKRTVATLLFAKGCDVLLKEPKCKAINPKDVLSLNMAWPKKMKKRKVTLATLPLDPPEYKAAEKVSEERKYVVDASIVRIMKARRKMSLAELTNEVVCQLGSIFKPTTRLVKTRVEHLIDTDYLCRSEDDPSTLKYVA